MMIIVIYKYNSQTRLKQLESCRSPYASDETFDDFDEASTVSFNQAGDEENEPSVGEEFGSVADTVVDLLASVFVKDIEQKLSSLEFTQQSPNRYLYTSFIAAMTILTGRNLDTL